MSKTENITIVIPTRKKEQSYVEHINYQFNNIGNQILVYENDNQFSLSELYNKGLDESVNDIIVFMHDDLILETPDITTKIHQLFKKNDDYGIIGLAGTTNLISGMWWEDRISMYGIVGHEHEGKKHVNFYNQQRFNDKVKDVVIIDGLFMMVHRHRIKNRFDEEFKGFHFYDIPFCFENYMNGVKIGVTTKIRVTHKSIGMVNKQWEKNKLFFEAKHGNLLPIKIG